MPVNGHIPAGKLTEIRAVILDYCEVLCHTPSTATIERLAAMFQMDPRTFLPIYLQTRVAYDRGDLLSSEYWQQFATQAGVKVGRDAIEQAGQLGLGLWGDLNDARSLWGPQLRSGERR